MTSTEFRRSLIIVAIAVVGIGSAMMIPTAIAWKVQREIGARLYFEQASAIKGCHQ
jgi:hypothetical protein